LFVLGSVVRGCDSHFSPSIENPLSPNVKRNKHKEVRTFFGRSAHHHHPHPPPPHSWRWRTRPSAPSKSCAVFGL